jgi:tetratricopeptide (TPR) repeat protein
MDPAAEVSVFRKTVQIPESRIIAVRLPLMLLKPPFPPPQPEPVRHAGATVAVLVLPYGRIDHEQQIFRPIIQMDSGAFQFFDRGIDPISQIGVQGSIARQAVQPMLILALAFEKRGELDKAIDLARQAADAAPKDFTAQYTYGRLCASTPRRQAEAYTVLENALKLKADDTNTLVLLCSIGIQRNEPSTDQYLNLLTHKPDFSRSAELYFMLGSRQAQKGNRDAAKRFMLDALNKCGGNRNPDFHYHIARCFDRNRFPANEIKQRYNLYLRIPGKKNPEYIADAGKRLRQLNSVR